METKIVSIEEINNWQLPPFQRPLRVNDKVRALAVEIKNSETIPGIITLGRVPPERALYIVDGQHRAEGARLSGRPEFIADVREVAFASMAEMAEEFVDLNTALVRMRPDDVLRGLEASNKNLARLRAECPFVEYDQVRRGSTTTPVVGMSALLRCWMGSAPDVPGSSLTNTMGLIERLDDDSTNQLIGFLRIALAAWGRDSEYHRLWGNINLTICMWLYRRLVLDKERRGGKRVAVLSQEAFKRCLMTLSARGDYLDWLPGRLMNDRDRSPCYMRIKAAFQSRIREETGKLPPLPSPSWASR